MSVAAQSLNADVEQVGASAYRIRITFPGVVAPDRAQAMLAEVGSHLRGGQAPGAIRGARSTPMRACPQRAPSSA
jgi:hypothetical protein